MAQARQTLIAALRAHALVKGEVTLTSGATAQYYVDAKRAVLLPAGFAALAELVAGYARRWVDRAGDRRRPRRGSRDRRRRLHPRPARGRRRRDPRGDRRGAVRAAG